ncbi:MFS transporter [Protaetiibacter intestinalis]|uniref:MFS transporter n=1 Tax=Protaetiibacter intestinalis TaxID=2419774 RepID=A0A387BC10_9MICO|nr:MFS transporter [Protaetiibacter intestinalis]AYF98429.1 MFS transporter [Protaetiibacter intestinalis]
MTHAAVSAGTPSGAPFAEPQRAVSGLWIAAFAAAWVGVWMAQLGPFRVALPLQVAGELGEGAAWTDSVVAFGVVSGVAGAFLILTFPIAGYLSDRTTSRFGRRRPWIAGGSALFAVGLVALGSVHGIALITVCWTVALVGFSAAASALTALINDQVPVRQRGWVAGWMSSPRAIGIILGAVLFTEVFATVTLGYLVLAATIVVLVVPVLVGVKDAPITAEQRPTTSLLAGLWISPKAHPDFAWTWVSGFLVNAGNALGTGLLLYYLAYELDFGDRARQAFLPLTLVYLLGVVLSALLCGWISDRIARRKVFVIWGALLQGLAALILVFTSDYTATFVAGAVLGLGYGAYLAVGQALATQVLPDARNRAKDLGIMNVAYQVPVAMAPLLGALIVASVGGFSGLFMLAGVVTAIGGAVIALVQHVK